MPSDPRNSAFFLNGQRAMGNAFKSNVAWLPNSQVWATLSDPRRSASFLNGQRFQIHANGKIFRLNLGNAFKSTQLSFQLKSTNPIRATSISNRLLNVGNSFKSKSQICFQIQCAVLYSASKLNPFSLQVQSQLGLQMQSQLSHRQIIPQWNFSLKSSQPSKSALATAELSNRGISPLNSSQPSNSTTLSADFTNLRSILQFLRRIFRLFRLVAGFLNVLALKWFNFTQNWTADSGRNHSQ